MRPIGSRGRRRWLWSALLRWLRWCRTSLPTIWCGRTARRAHGEAGLTVRLVALTVKGLIYASSMVMLDAALPGRQDVDVEFVTLRVGHAAPQETLEFAGGSGFEPATAGLFYFRRRLVEVVYHQVKMHAVLA
jgi:hypothetical protein